MPAHDRDHVGGAAELVTKVPWWHTILPPPLPHWYSRCQLYQDVWQAVPQIEAEIMSKKQAMQDIVANGYWRVMRATSTPSVIC